MPRATPGRRERKVTVGPPVDATRCLDRGGETRHTGAVSVHPLDDWSFRPVDPAVVPVDADWPLPAEVPGSAHTDLLRHGLIPDPFVDAGEAMVAWVADVDWVYETTIAGDAGLFEHDRVDLVFEGLDTLAEIRLDGEEIARTENMHRSYRIPLTVADDGGPHRLEVTFRSATREADRRNAEWGDYPAASFERPYNFVRKMACSWGWDWGPWLTTAGIWRPARVEAWNRARLVSVVPLAMVDPSDHGSVDVRVETEVSGPVGVSVRARLLTASGELVVDGEIGGDRLILAAGTVARWRRRGRGEQPRYRLEVDLLAGDDVVDTWSGRIGFRSVELDTTSDDVGSAFTLVVNDEPIFARGVNWIPDDPLVTRVDRERYRRRLDEAVELGVDLVRVWGGGIYESDDFYDLCDEMGLLVWQDFAFACAAYPEELLVDEVRAEAEENVRRLAPHPSLVVWNGNNENNWGAVDWGWMERLGDRAWGDGFYRELLPSIVAELDPTRPYSVASPYSGSPDIHPNADEHGTRHIWDVWNEVDYVHYRDHVPRFVSEFGWQAPPPVASLREATTEPLHLESPLLAARQKAMNGQEKLARGLETHFATPERFEDWVWATQLNQARAVTTGVEHLRSHRGVCMGAVWWQLNDCWPSISWAVLDSKGRRKPAWFALQHAFADRLLTIQPRREGLALIAVNDSPEQWADRATVRRLSFAGDVLAEFEAELELAAGSAQTWELPIDVGTATAQACELVRAVASSGTARPTDWFFAVDKELDYPMFDVGVTVDGDTVTVVANEFVRDITLIPSLVEPSLEVGDALVTLLPGESAEFGLAGASDHDAVEAAVFSANHLTGH